MKTADEMFEKMDFIKVEDTDKKLIYKTEYYAFGNKFIHHIMFDKIGREIFSYKERREEQIGIGIGELQAINKKCQELRMDLGGVLSERKLYSRRYRCIK